MDTISSALAAYAPHNSFVLVSLSISTFLHVCSLSHSLSPLALSLSLSLFDCLSFLASPDTLDTISYPLPIYASHGMSNLTVNATETINKWSTHFQFH